MDNIDNNDKKNAPGAKNCLTDEQKAARLKKIRKSAEKMMSRKKERRAVEQESFPVRDYIKREIEELVELGFSHADAIRSATRIYTNARFDKFIDD